MPGNRAVMLALEGLLPARFNGVRAADSTAGGGKLVQFDNLVLQPGATRSAASDGTQLLSRAVGKGKVVLVGDTEFALNRNLEHPSGGTLPDRRENTHFWRWLLSYLRGQTPWGPPDAHWETAPEKKRRTDQRSAQPHYPAKVPGITSRKFQGKTRPL